VLPGGAGSALSVTSLTAAANLLAQQMDTGGEPIFNDPAVLISTAVAQDHGDADRQRPADPAQTAGGADAGGAQQLDTANLFQGLKVAVEPYISRIITNGTSAGRRGSSPLTRHSPSARRWSSGSCRVTRSRRS